MTKKYRMTTDIPDFITTPDRTETRLGPLEAWFDQTWRSSEIELV